jgi:hypothetical protein
MDDSTFRGGVDWSQQLRVDACGGSHVENDTWLFRTLEFFNGKLRSINNGGKLIGGQQAR